MTRALWPVHTAVAAAADRIKCAMPNLTRPLHPDRADCWLVYYGDVHVGNIAPVIGNSKPQWKWLCGFYPGSRPGEQRGGSAERFDQARAAFEAAWRDYLPTRTEADFHAWRDQRDWTARKYAALDRSEKVPLR